MTRFEGFGPRVREWFEGLEADNSRAYFSAHRAFFEESVRGQMAALLTDPSATFGGKVKLFRPNRDIRFSANQPPYKTNTYGLLLVAQAEKKGLEIWSETLATAPRGYRPTIRGSRCCGARALLSARGWSSEPRTTGSAALMAGVL